MRRTQCTPTSAPKQAQQLAKLNLSSHSTITVISFLIDIFCRLNALSTPFYAANAMHADFSVETSTATRKTQSFLDLEENLLFRFWLRYFGVQTLFPLHSMRRTQCIPISASKQAQQLAKLNISFLSTKTVISFLIEIFRRLNAPSTPFYAANAVHAEFSVETSAATRKTQTFLDFDEYCYFVPDCDISAFIRSIHSILCGERSAYRFQRRNKPSNSQNSIFLRIRR
jgi:hypothetical protein